MLVSRSEWEKLERRVKRLEDAHPGYDDPHSITVYYPQNHHPFPGSLPMPSETIALKDLVLRIVKHLGMGLKYRGGQPAGVDLVPLTPPNNDEG